MHVRTHARTHARTHTHTCTLYRCSDNGPIKKKMLYASSKDTIKKSFEGLSHEFQANDLGDFDYSTFADEVERKA